MRRSKKLTITVMLHVLSASNFSSTRKTSNDIWEHSTLDFLKKCHPKPSGIKCDDCEEIFNNFETFKMHSRKHMSPTEHKCDECHATFSSKTNLNRHSLEEHNIVNINVKKTSLKHYPFTCDECDFYTKRKHYLQLHMIKMHGPDPKMMSCNLCQETFKYRSNLSRHQRRLHESEIIISDILNTLFSIYIISF